MRHQDIRERLDRHLVAEPARATLAESLRTPIDADPFARARPELHRSSCSERQATEHVAICQRFARSCTHQIWKPVPVNVLHNIHVHSLPQKHPTLRVRHRSDALASWVAELQRHSHN